MTSTYVRDSRRLITLVRLLAVGLFALIAISEGAKADLAPPPPAMPIVGGDVPSPTGPVVAGIALSAACVCAGWMVVRTKKARIAKGIVAGLLLFAAVGAFVLANSWAKTHAQYEVEKGRARANSRANQEARYRYEMDRQKAEERALSGEGQPNDEAETP